MLGTGKVYSSKALDVLAYALLGRSYDTLEARKKVRLNILTGSRGSNRGEKKQERAKDCSPS